jgi:hypothetical protein
MNRSQVSSIDGAARAGQSMTDPERQKVYCTSGTGDVETRGKRNVKNRCVMKRLDEYGRTQYFSAYSPCFDAMHSGNYVYGSSDCPAVASSLIMFLTKARYMACSKTSEPCSNGYTGEGW